MGVERGWVGGNGGRLRKKPIGSVTGAESGGRARGAGSAHAGRAEAAGLWRPWWAADPGFGAAYLSGPGVEVREVGAAVPLPAGMDAPVTPGGCVRTSGNKRPRKN